MMSSTAPRCPSRALVEDRLGGVGDTFVVGKVGMVGKVGKVGLVGLVGLVIGSSE
jgi:hypothetical protein